MSPNRIHQGLLILWIATLAPASRGEVPWPPPLPGAIDGSVVLEDERLLVAPESVEAARLLEGSAPFVIATRAPRVTLAFHDGLGPAASERRLWSSWGGICRASDGRVYCGIGDHGDDAGGDARCLLYAWSPDRRRLEQVLDVNSLLPRPSAERPHSRWSKLHARIDEGPDGGIYFSATLNDGNRAGRDNFHWSEQCPGGQLYRYDPSTGQAEVHASLPPRRCTATSRLDRERGRWWCVLESGGGNALWCLDLRTREVLLQTADGAVGFDRELALASDGALLFNGPESLLRATTESQEVERVGDLPMDSPGIRCASRETSSGQIYGVLHKTNRLFRLDIRSGEFTDLGPSWLAGSYTASCALSPDERFLYYLPGAHGGAFKDGTPVIQYELASGRRKALAFLRPAIEERCGYVPAGTYGMALSKDGGTLYANLNGHPVDALRPAHLKPIGFGLCAFVAIEIPAAER